MKHQITLLSGLLLAAALPSLAQSPDPNSNAKPKAPDSNLPANPAAEKKKPKKVWTNDEIGKVSGGVSVVGDSNASTNDSKKKSEEIKIPEEARQHQIDTYRKQLNLIQTQIADIDRRISQLKSFKGENTSPSGGININQGYNMVPIDDQVKQLEAKKKELQSKMDDVESDARKTGIDSDDLR
jgi:DNA repair exonuclease SbcCD ATPase subunit